MTWANSPASSLWVILSTPNSSSWVVPYHGAHCPLARLLGLRQHLITDEGYFSSRKPLVRVTALRQLTFEGLVVIVYPRHHSFGENTHDANAL
jgi:hypothetical protein